MTNCPNIIGREFVGLQIETDVYKAAVAAASQVFDIDTCLVAIADNTMLRPKASTQRDPDWSSEGIPIATSIPGQVYKRGESHVIDDLADVRSVAAAQDAGATSRGSYTGRGFRSLLIAPIGDIGVLIAAAGEPAAFSVTDRETARRIGDFAAGALEGIHSPHSTDPDRLDEIASILSHDLKSPLQVVRGHIELAEASGDVDDLPQAIGALDRIEELADDLAILARTDQRIGRIESVGLDELVETAWSTVQSSVAELNLERSVELLADKSTACQLLENLFMNAVDHGGPGVTIRVGPLEEGFYVEDDGPGIPPDDREQVFEWGYSSSGGHNGLGLAIVDKIARAHDWDVSIAESESGGTRFEIAGVETD